MKVKLSGEIEIPDDVMEGVIEDLIQDVAFEDATIKDLVREAVRQEVRIQAPGNPRIATVIKEVQEHLDRYPSVAHDQGLQDAVGKAIFDYFQKTL